MSKELEIEIIEYIDKIAGDTENQTIVKASRKLNKLLWNFRYTKRIVLGAYIFAVVFIGFWSYLAISTKDTFAILIGIVGGVLIVLAAIVGKKIDTFFTVKRFDKLKTQIDTEF